ncbi:MAG: outer membrane protein transport protein [Deltaproteobacteria bacterium]|nr:outer membrane protein transport protein [Deltaproteobacteria bacterium]
MPLALALHPAPERRVRNARRSASVLLCCVALGVARVVLATPLDEPFVGGVGFAGPTTGDITAVYWNPAALSLLTGTEFHASGVFGTAITSVQRAPNGGTAFPKSNGSGTLISRPWSPGPGQFLGVGANVLGRFTLALAGYWPSYERVRYEPSSDGSLPTRYHGIDLDLRNFALVPALAIRFGKYIHLGFAPGFLFASGHFTFDDDSGINQGMPVAENPTFATRYNLNAGDSTLAPNPAYTLGAGLHYKKDDWSVGIAYTSRTLGNDGDGVRLSIRDGSIANDSGGALQSPCPPKDNAPCLNGELSYRLPDTFIAGATWQMNERWSFTGTARYQTFSVHNRMVLTLAAPVGSGLGENGVRSRIVLDRGFQNRLEVRGNVIRKFGPRARVGGGLRVASSAVPLDYVTPIAVDGLAFSPFAMAEVTVRAFSFRAGYAFTYMPERDVTNSVFNPNDASTCVSSGYDLANAACKGYSQGTARPSANGRYSYNSHTLSVSLIARF